jgi:hypothetical protein
MQPLYSYSVCFECVHSYCTHECDSRVRWKQTRIWRPSFSLLGLPTVFAAPFALSKAVLSEMFHIVFDLDMQSWHSWLCASDLELFVVFQLAILHSLIVVSPLHWSIIPLGLYWPRLGPLGSIQLSLLPHWRAFGCCWLHPRVHIHHTQWSFHCSWICQLCPKSDWGVERLKFIPRHNFDQQQVDCFAFYKAKHKRANQQRRKRERKWRNHHGILQMESSVVALNFVVAVSLSSIIQRCQRHKSESQSLIDRLGYAYVCTNSTWSSHYSGYSRLFKSRNVSRSQR